MKGFERHCRRTEELKCSPGKRNRTIITQDEADEAESDDKVEILWEERNSTRISVVIFVRADPRTLLCMISLVAFTDARS